MLHPLSYLSLSFPQEANGVNNRTPDIRDHSLVVQTGTLWGKKDNGSEEDLYFSSVSVQLFLGKPGALLVSVGVR